MGSLVLQMARSWTGRCALWAAAAALAALLRPAGGVSMSQPSTASIQSASQNVTVLAAGAEDAFVGNYSAGAADVAACLPLSVKFYDAQRSGKVRALRRRRAWPRHLASGGRAGTGRPGLAQVPAADARVAWRKDSGLYDEVQGGFYDAGALRPQVPAWRSGRCQTRRRGR